MLGLGIPSLMLLWASVTRQVGIAVEDDCARVRMSVVFPDRYIL